MMSYRQIRDLRVLKERVVAGQEESGRTDDDLVATPPRHLPHVAGKFNGTNNDYDDRSSLSSRKLRLQRLRNKKVSESSSRRSQTSHPVAPPPTLVTSTFDETNDRSTTVSTTRSSSRRRRRIAPARVSDTESEGDTHDREPVDRSRSSALHHRRRRRHRRVVDETTSSSPAVAETRSEATDVAHNLTSLLLRAAIESTEAMAAARRDRIARERPSRPDARPREPSSRRETDAEPPQGSERVSAAEARSLRARRASSRDDRRRRRRLARDGSNDDDHKDGSRCASLSSRRSSSDRIPDDEARGVVAAAVVSPASVERPPRRDALSRRRSRREQRRQQQLQQEQQTQQQQQRQQQPQRRRSRDDERTNCPSTTRSKSTSANARSSRVRRMSNHPNGGRGGRERGA